jgi:DNA-directed RNA polymerase I subunit RPA1
MRAMKDSDVGANVIRGLKLKKSTSSVENPDGFDDSGIDALSEVEDGDKETREKSTEVAAEFEEHNSKRDLLPSEVRNILKHLWQNEHEFCSFIGDLWQSGSEKIDYSMFFLESVLVPPTKFRPPTTGGDSVSNSLQIIMF